MPFIAYLYECEDATPYMEVLSPMDLAGASIEARRLLADHASAVYAEVWEGEQRVFTTLTQSVHQAQA